MSGTDSKYGESIMGSSVTVAEGIRGISLMKLHLRRVLNKADFYMQRGRGNSRLVLGEQ